MCGRFVIDATWEELREWYNLINTTPLKLRPSYNVTPTQNILICANTDGPGTLTASTARWGLIPNWWKKPLKDLPSTINARGETVAEKPMFRSAFKSR
ncbi:MAG: SOS response-associated peptidase family protein, partial [Methyloligellaceae bacterium]